MIKIAVCDDSKYIAKALKKMLEGHEFSEKIEVDAFESGKELYESARENRYNVLLMDIELSDDSYSLNTDENGMLLADAIKDRYPETLTIFISRYSQYQKDLLRHEPFAFIGKPVLSDNRFFEIVEEAISKIRNRESNHAMYPIKAIKGVCFVAKVKDILYFESQRPKVKVVMIDDEVTFRKRLDVVEDEVSELTNDFVRVNKSFLVNMRHIKEYTSRSVTMLNGVELSFGRKYIEKFKEKISNLC